MIDAIIYLLGYNDDMTESEKLQMEEWLMSGDPDAWAIVASVMGKRRSAAKSASSAKNGEKGGRPVGAKDSKPRTRKGRSDE